MLQQSSLRVATRQKNTANIRAWRKPEPYKRQGIIYDGEAVQEGRKSGASA